MGRKSKKPAVPATTSQHYEKSFEAATETDTNDGVEHPSMQAHEAASSFEDGAQPMQRSDNHRLGSAEAEHESSSLAPLSQVDHSSKNSISKGK